MVEFRGYARVFLKGLIYHTEERPNTIKQTIIAIAETPGVDLEVVGAKCSSEGKGQLPFTGQSLDSGVGDH